MTNHLFLIDPLEKLGLSKDSSILLAATLQEAGERVYFLFPQDLYFTNEKEPPIFKVFPFKAQFQEGSFYLRDVQLEEEISLSLDNSTLLHIRLDPPFDTRYLSYQWMLKGLKELHGLVMINDPSGIILNNEKLVAFEQVSALTSFVGDSVSDFERFALKQQREGWEGLVLKPLNLFQGIGVEKLCYSLGREKLRERFREKAEEYRGPLIAQPFVSEVARGEVRTIFFNGEHLGSILKVPREGGFLTNIAQGATYTPHELSQKQEEECRKLCYELRKQGILWVAFDLLGDKIQEVNITCPGLLVEVSKALGKNLALSIGDILGNGLSFRSCNLN